MSGDLRTPTVSKVIGYISYLQILFLHACARDITLLEPKSTIYAQIGEELRITCPGTKCQNPDFTWAALADSPLSGTTNNIGQISVLTMKISRENLDLYGSYRCTVACDNPPVEKSFKVVVYSFPKPILTISSRIAGEQSRITCTIPDAYPFYMFDVRMLIGEMMVKSNPEADIDDIHVVKNISLSHDLILTDQHEAQVIQCEAALPIHDDETEPINEITSMLLNLLYPPGKPSITVYPGTTVNAAENISLSCTFQSKSPASVQWVKLDKENELIMPSDDQGILTLPNAEPEDSGIYICRVQNDAGHNSSQVQIVVQDLPEKPTLTIYPTTIVQVGQSVTIECSANGNKNVIVTLWKVLRDSEIPLLEANGKVIIEEADPNDTAVYKCVAKNQYGVSEASVSLTVEYPPVETALTSSDEEVNEGGEITLTCTSKGVPEPNFFIYQLLPSGDNDLLSEGPVVTLTNVTSGVYQCEARNSLGSKKAKLELKVRFPPRNTFLAISSSLVVREGESLHIRCRSEAYPAPRLVLKLKTKTGLTELETENGQYSVTHVTKEHAGIYICESSNVVGQEEAKAPVIVHVPPRNTFLAISPSLVMREGESVHIRCTSEAYPAPSLVLKQKTETGLTELEAENGQYSITHVTEEHAGSYICESSNAVGQEEAKATVIVQVPPKNTHITITPSTAVSEGEFIDIRCSSEASPAPTLALKVRTEHGVRELISEGGQYQIAHAGMKHSGTYICVSTNIIGQQEVETTVTIQVLPKKTVLTISPSPLLKEGESGHIRCTSEAFPAPRLVLKKQTEAGLIELESESGEYSITHAGVEHAGIYICESTNEAGQQIVETTLSVTVAPKNTFISIIPSSVVNEGDDVQIQCMSEAYPSPRLVLMMKTEHGLMSQLKSEDGVYNITNAGEKNMGTYICESTNVVGQQTAEAMLTIQVLPRNTTIVIPSQNITAGVIVTTIMYDTHIIPPPEQQQSPRFDYVPPAIIGSVVLVTAGFIGTIAYLLKQAKVQGSYSLVKALRSKV